MPPDVSAVVWDNAVVESFLATLKSELVYLRRFQPRQEAKEQIVEYLKGFYNRQRWHSSLGYLSPVKFEERTGLVIHRIHYTRERSKCPTATLPRPRSRLIYRAIRGIWFV